MCDLPLLVDAYEWFLDSLSLPIEDAGGLFFSELGHFGNVSLNGFSSDNPHTFFYRQLPDNRMLNSFDYFHMGAIKRCAYLARVDSSAFDFATQDVISYYAVDLSCSVSDRSSEAYGIHYLISKCLNSYSVVLFRHNTSLLLSTQRFTENGRIEIVLSDWLNEKTYDLGQLEAARAEYCSSSSIPSFFSCLTFSIAREYYKYPITMFMARYQMTLDTINASWLLDLPFPTREDLNDAVMMAFETDVNNYGNDYIESQIEDGLADFDREANELTDFDELEWELDQAELNLDDDANILETDEEYYDRYEYDCDDIDQAILNDAVKLDEYLQKADTTSDPLKR